MQFCSVHRLAGSLLILAMPLVSCRLLPATPKPDAPPTPRAALPATVPALSLAPINAPHLPNAHRINDKLISGGQPEGDEGFRELAALGVKTIISVDGITPNVDAAHRYGMHYVHLPFGYDTVPTDRGQQIAKAIEDMPGPIYLHCHHGKHRSAAAVAVACVSNGMIPPEEARDVLKTFGTGENYKGLWQSADEAKPLGAAQLSAVKVPYAEITPLPPLAATMVLVDGVADRLKKLEANGWLAAPDHPELDPAHQALQLEELLTEVQRSDAAKDHPADFQTKLDATIGTAKTLCRLLEDPMHDRTATSTAYKAVTASCLDCHKQYRDQ